VPRTKKPDHKLFDNEVVKQTSANIRNQISDTMQKIVQTEFSTHVPTAGVFEYGQVVKQHEIYENC